MRAGVVAIAFVLGGCRINFEPLRGDADSDGAQGCVSSGAEGPGRDASCRDGIDNDCDGLFDDDEDACPVQLFRSAGVATADFNTAGATVELAGDKATFSSALPDQVGVGDAIEIRSPTTALVFVRERITDRTFRVRTATGTVPAAVAPGTAAAVFRAYASLGAWQAGDENDAIADALENFDSSRDLVARDAIVNVALYDDGVDAANVVITGWLTSPDHYVRLFTPVGRAEAGTSQRHRGVYGSGYRIEATAFTHTLDVQQSHVRIEGLSVKSFLQVGPGFAAIQIIGTSGDIDVRISHCIADGNDSQGTNGVVHLEASGPLAAGTFRNSNNLAYGAPDLSSECFWHRDFDGATAEFYVFNNTAFDCQRGIEARDTFGRVHAINNIAIAGGIGFYDFNGGGSFSALSTHNVSSDATAAMLGTPIRQNATATELFVSSTPPDLHLIPTSPVLGLGLDLSGDVVLPILDDIDGEPRRLASEPGADQR